MPGVREGTGKMKRVKKIGRKRRTLGWTLLTLGLLVTGVWVWSGWQRFYLFFWSISDNANVRLLAGVLELRVEEPRPPRDSRSDLGAAIKEELLPWRRPGWRVYWTPVFSAESDQWKYVYKVTLWPIPLLLWTPAALLLRSGILARRRAITGSCPKCGYSLAGLPAGSPCPECSKAKVPA
jgi:hypothetical protein